MVRNIFLKFSACEELVKSNSPDILVKPSMMDFIFPPNIFSISSRVMEVSSTVSWSKAQTIEVVPSPISSPQILATANG